MPTAQRTARQIHQIVLQEQYWSTSYIYSSRGVEVLLFIDLVQV